jgi:hypothetical protein
MESYKNREVMDTERGGGETKINWVSQKVQAACQKRTLPLAWHLVVDGRSGTLASSTGWYARSSAVVLQAQIKPYMMETEDRPVELADPFVADDTITRRERFESFSFAGYLLASLPATKHFFHERHQYPKINRLRKDTAHASLDGGSYRGGGSPARYQGNLHGGPGRS